MPACEHIGKQLERVLFQTNCTADRKTEERPLNEIRNNSVIKSQYLNNSHKDDTFCMS